MRLLASALLSCRLFATNYYVASNGNNSNNGTRTATPWLTIAKVNGSTFSAGDTISLRCGDLWNENLTVPSGGSSGNPITIGNYTLTTCPALPSLVGDATNPVITDTRNFVTIQDIKVSGGGTFGVSIQADSIHDVTVQRMEITTSQGAGLLLANVFNQTTTAATGLNALNNYIHDNGGHGIQYLFRVQSSTASGNTIARNGSIPGMTGWHGMSAFGIGNGADPSLLTWTLNDVSGTVWTMAGGEGAGIQSDNNSSFLVITSNYVHGNGGYGIAAATPSNNDTISGNLVCGNGAVSLLPGIVINNSHDNLVTLNTVVSNGTGIVLFSTNSVNNTITHNIIANNGLTELSRNDIASGFLSNSNNIYHAAGGTAYMAWNGSTFNLAGWQVASGQDANSTSTDPGNVCPGGVYARGITFSGPIGVH